MDEIDATSLLAVVAAAAAVAGLASTGIDVGPVRSWGGVTAKADFAGPSDPATAADLSDDIAERLADGKVRGWNHAHRIEIDRTRAGFRLSIDLRKTGTPARAV